MKNIPLSRKVSTPGLVFNSAIGNGRLFSFPMEVYIYGQWVKLLWRNTRTTYTFHVPCDPQNKLLKSNQSGSVLFTPPGAHLAWLPPFGVTWSLFNEPNTGVSSKLVRLKPSYSLTLPPIPHSHQRLWNSPWLLWIIIPVCTKSRYRFMFESSAHKPLRGWADKVGPSGPKTKQSNMQYVMTLWNGEVLSPWGGWLFLYFRKHRQYTILISREYFIGRSLFLF